MRKWPGQPLIRARKREGPVCSSNREALLIWTTAPLTCLLEVLYWPPFQLRMKHENCAQLCRSLLAPPLTSPQSSLVYYNPATLLPLLVVEHQVKAHGLALSVPMLDAPLMATFPKHHSLYHHWLFFPFARGPLPHHSLFFLQSLSWSLPESSQLPLVHSPPYTFIDKKYILLLLYVWVFCFACMPMYNDHDHRCQKRASNPLGLELQTVSGHHVIAGNWTWAPWKSSQLRAAHNCWAISSSAAIRNC